ncbi:NTP transferase domain-containing protein [Shewanella avicenniae]|uniref:NTP transferase domain-containing protein n=1 Tax=Shewanella avicenniae TaxID=2814294 RepID=A0ABX7QQY6_9GAMM|nr:NTP transferase domain-containing protein [Shewanella avicenniae]QSX33315.1 NTP transferase domain-containing protein [Shewanella avicenniae]
MASQSQVGILLLAAGKGERFIAAGGEGNKLLAMYPNANGDQVPLLAFSLSQAVASGLPVRLVTRPSETAVIALAEQFGAEVTLIDSQGSSETIAAGVRDSAEWAGWLIAPADMGWLHSSDYLQVAAALTSDDAQARLMFEEVPGHPVGFGKGYYAVLSQLQGDKGARALLQNSKLQRLSGHIGVIKDADLPAH